MQATANHIHLSRMTEVWYHGQNSAAAWGTKTIDDAASVLLAYGEPTVTVKFHVGRGHEKKDLRTFSKRLAKLSQASGYQFSEPTPVYEGGVSYQATGVRE